MASCQDEFKRILDEEVRDYADRALGLLAQAIEAKGLVLTEELLHSLRTEVTAATAQNVAMMGVLFEQYGRIKDMKGYDRTKAPPSDVLQFGLDLLDQDKEGREKHHAMCVALAAAKIIMDGTREVQAIWEYSAEQPENSVTAGVFGTVLAGVQTALAVGRTAIALGKIGAGGGSGGGAATGWVATPATAVAWPSRPWASCCSSRA
ncbi:MAG: hypothetical protein ACRYFK_05970 [Janthinobacterium lividum]